MIISHFHRPLRLTRFPALICRCLLLSSADVGVATVAAQANEMMGVKQGSRGGGAMIVMVATCCHIEFCILGSVLSISLFLCSCVCLFVFDSVCMSLCVCVCVHVCVCVYLFLTTYIQYM